MVTAGYLLLVSSALHAIGFLLTGLESESLFLLFPAVLYIGLCYGLIRRITWVAWIAFLCMLGGMAGTVVEIYGLSPVPALILWGILFADLGAAIMLFRAIRAGPGAREV